MNGSWCIIGCIRLQYDAWEQSEDEDGGDEDEDGDEYAFVFFDAGFVFGFLSVHDVH